MRRRRHQPTDQLSSLHPDPQHQGRVRITQVAYESPQPIPLIHPSLYTPPVYRILVAALTVFGAMFKFYLTTAATPVTTAIPSTYPTPTLADVPFLLCSMCAGLSLSYWTLLPYPAQYLWPDPHLPGEVQFIKGQYQATPTTRCWGLAILFLGIGGMMVSASALGSSWSPLATPVWGENDATQGWVHTGPYATVRHPMYVCSCLIAIGLSCTSGNVYVGTSWLLLASSLVVRAFHEEHQLSHLVLTNEGIAPHDKELFQQWMASTSMFVPQW